MSQFRVEKRRAEAEVTLASGESRRGCFFLSSSSAVHAGPERVKDVLNFESGFFPFETADPARMVFVNREQVVTVRLIGPREEPKRDSGYDVALRATSRCGCRIAWFCAASSASTVQSDAIASATTRDKPNHFVTLKPPTAR
jgi:hypothetical protein